MAEIGNAGVAPDQIEAHRRDGEGERLGPKLGAVFVAEKRHDGDDGDQRGADQQKIAAARAHARRQVKPAGQIRRITTATTMTTTSA